MYVEKAAHLLQDKGGNVPVFLKGRCNIPPFPKAATGVGVNMSRDVKHEVGQ